MVQAAIGFFIVGLLAYVLGANNVAGLSVELGTTLLILFVALAIISFIFQFFRNGKQKV